MTYERRLSGGESLVLREALDEGFSQSPDDVVQEKLDEILTELDEGALDGIGNALKKLQKSLPKVAAQAAPGVITGATTGAAAGPWGALLGGLVGGGLSLATQPRKKGKRTPKPSVAAAATGQSANQPAAKLLQLVQNPQLLQALVSLTLGKGGKTTVPVGKTEAPAASFLNLLTTLAGQAGAKAEQFYENVPDAYLLESSGDFAYDPSDPEERASALLEHLESTGECAPAEGQVADPVTWLRQARALKVNSY